jgi:hypothetical protein
MGFVFKKLLNASTWKRIGLERLTEPLHLNLVSIAVALFGSFRAKVAFDLCVRQHNAFGLLRAADNALWEGIQEVTVVEFGVASGAGLMNLCRLAERVTRETGVKFRIAGFDSGTGMPEPRDYRDHPGLYGASDFQMGDPETLRAVLPANAELIIGNVADTVGPFLASLSPASPLGYVVLDVDYYSSSVECLKIFEGAADKYLPNVVLFADDVMFIDHNDWQGELLAINEFNSRNDMRKIGLMNRLGNHRIFRNARWLTQMFYVHILDNECHLKPRSGARVTLQNPYLKNSR